MYQSTSAKIVLDKKKKKLKSSLVNNNQCLFSTHQSKDKLCLSQDHLPGSSLQVDFKFTLHASSFFLKEQTNWDILSSCICVITRERTKTHATSHGLDTSTNTSLVSVSPIAKPNIKGQGNTTNLHGKPIIKQFFTGQV